MLLEPKPQALPLRFFSLQAQLRVLPLLLLRASLSVVPVSLPVVRPEVPVLLPLEPWLPLFWRHRLFVRHSGHRRRVWLQLVFFKLSFLPVWPVRLEPQGPLLRLREQVPLQEVWRNLSIQ